jgi:DNA-binding transcriptional ArsR family regulator
MDPEDYFKRLSHPIRVQILQELNGTSLGFSELKKKLGVSNGQLEHHLSKLDGLVSEGGGSYALTGEGQKALHLLDGFAALKSRVSVRVKLQVAGRYLLLSAGVYNAAALAFSLTLCFIVYRGFYPLNPWTLVSLSFGILCIPASKMMSNAAITLILLFLGVAASYQYLASIVTHLPYLFFVLVFPSGLLVLAGCSVYLAGNLFLTCGLEAR